LLVEQERVHELRGIDSVEYRVCSGEPHQHLVCLRCGRVEEEPLSAPAAWLESVTRDGFSVEHLAIEIQETCSRC
jgi:Fe2+ or Zn2+ uptake regulation protein